MAFLRASVVLVVLAMTTFLARGDTPKPASGLTPLAFHPLPLGSIKPKGWLKQQLRIQADGLTGHLDEFWPDIKDSAWIGGKAEGWERAPYWLDGLVPLAVELEDPRLMAKACRYLDYILDHQAPDGWLGSVGDSQNHEAYDPWPLYVVFKAMTQFQEATGDPRVVPAIRKALRKIDEVITRTPLHSWAQFRSADLLVTIAWLQERSPETWLLELAAKVRHQGFDWSKLYGPDYPYIGRPNEPTDMDNHGVNTGMAWKYAGMHYRFTGDPADRAATGRMLSLLDTHHGQATGMFTCDEHLSGRSPSQGTELCTVVEAMYSLELLMSLHADPALGDRLERIAYNALPATFSPDMCAHQYDQQANQAVCKLAPEHVYRSNGDDANLYGLEPNFGCCTANMHQGWPKFASQLAMTTPGDGLVLVAYAPAEIDTQLGGQSARVSVVTDYPFRDQITLKIRMDRPAKFPIHLRIPSWTDSAKVDIGAEHQVARPGTFHTIDREWSGTTEVQLTLGMPILLGGGFNDSVTISRGPLLYVLKIEEERRVLKGDPPFTTSEVLPKSPWNYALVVNREHPERTLTFEDQPLGPRPFSPEGAPVVGKARGRLVPSWKLEKNAAAPPPPSPLEGEGPLVDLSLLPYGCTNLRITEFPVLKARGAESP